MSTRLPVLVLAGSDSRRKQMPRAATPVQSLTGFKGLLPLPGGGTLLGELLSRLRASERFREPVVLGPARVYSGQVDAEVVDVEGDISRTIRAALAAAPGRFDPAEPVALIAYDVLPTIEELRRVLDEHYAPHAARAFWWQIVEATPEDMGASGWKPAYRLPPAAGAAPLSLYPGHLAVVRPAALRTELASKLLGHAYRQRNLPLARRLLPLLGNSLTVLLAEDLRNLARGQWPILTWQLPWLGMLSYWRYRRRRLTLPDLERAFATLLLHREWRRRLEGRPAAISVCHALGLARDIDTPDELAAAATHLTADHLPAAHLPADHRAPPPAADARQGDGA